MTKYRVRITRVLEDGTEVELVSVCDEPWYISPILKDMAKRVHLPMPPPKLAGQMALGEAA